MNVTASWSAVFLQIYCSLSRWLIAHALILWPLVWVLQDTKAAQETKALQDFYSRLSTDSARAFYGSGHVMAAHELQAIHTLLISDRLFRTNDIAKVCYLALQLF